MKLFARVVCLLFALVLFSSCENIGSEKSDQQDMRFGKELNVTVLENEIIDVEYLQSIYNGGTENDATKFALWDKKELKKMIDYMNENNLILAPGEYTFNQAWRFNDGLLVINNGEKREVFKFVES